MISKTDHERVAMLLKAATADPKMAVEAANLLTAYHAQCNAILGQRMTPQGADIKIAEAHLHFMAALTNVVEPFFAAGEPNALDSNGTPAPEPPAEQYKLALFDVISAWRLVCPIGFAAIGGQHTKTLLEAITRASKLVPAGTTTSQG